MIPDPLVVEIAGRSGVDWVGLDLQHGTWDVNLAFRGIQLLDVMGVPALVRVSELELPQIPRVLDHGASGVVIAMSTGPDMVAHAVSMARYAPEGTRSYGGQRYGMRAEPDDVTEVRPAVYPMVEDARGVEAVEAIAAVPGIAGLHIGPVDMGLGMGLGRDRSDPRFGAAFQRILQAGHQAGVPVTMHAVRGEQAAHWTEMGYDDVVLTADVDLLRGAFAEHVSKALGRPADGPVGPYGGSG